MGWPQKGETMPQPVCLTFRSIVTRLWLYIDSRLVWARACGIQCGQGAEACRG